MRHRFLSPAKVNLFLKVISRRADGYHNIVSLVDVITLHDELFIEEVDEDAVIVDDNLGILPKDEGNTVYRAAMALKERYGIRKGIKIFIEKRIPMGSGLGGPSSNAATTLKALVQIWDLDVDGEELASIGKGIGADVPLFLFGKPSVMKGIGDLITAVALPRLWYIIVYPNYFMSTREVYEGLKISLTKEENDVKLRRHFLHIAEVSSILENDLEKVAIPICSKIKDIKEKLAGAGAMGSLMSGSGSSVFGIFENQGDAVRALPVVQDFGSVFLARSISFSQ